MANTEEDQPSVDPPADSPERPPSRILPLVAGLIGPGTGHFIAGLPRRGAAFALSGMALHLGASLAVARAPSVPVLALLALPLLVHLASLLDLARLPKERILRVRLAAVGQVLAYVVANFFLRNLIQNHILVFFQLPSGSMEPTMAQTDVFLTSKLDATTSRGAVMVFPNPEKPEDTFVKRVIGLAGDTVSERAGVISINGEPIRRCTVGKLQNGSVLVLERLGDHTYFVQDVEATTENERKWTVAPNEVFVIGDNRANSHDSRTWFGGEGGGVKVDQLLGRATFHVFRAGAISLGPVDDLALPPGADGLRDAVAKCRGELGG